MEYLKSQIAPGFNAPLTVDQFHIKAGLYTVKTLTQRNNIPLANRTFTGGSITMCLVSDTNALYKQVNEPGTQYTTNADWEAISLGVDGGLFPVGNWNPVTNSPALTDTGAIDRNGEFYFVVGAGSGYDFTDASLFGGVTTHLFNGDWIISIGNAWTVVRPTVTWDMITKPTSITDYVAGIVIDHVHDMSDVTGLLAALDLKYDISDTADHTIPFVSVPNQAIVEVEFLKQWYYTKSEVLTLISLAGGVIQFTGLVDVPSSYIGHGSQFVKVKSTEDGLEFVNAVIGTTNPFDDNIALVKNSVDATKLAIFSAATISTGTTRTYVLPNTNGTLALAATTLAGYGITDGVSTGGSYANPSWITSLAASKITGVLDISNIPAAALERVFIYAGGATTPETAGLTLTDVQNGDVVKMNSTGLMYIVANDAALSTAGSFVVFNAGTAASVPWTGVTSKPAIITSLAGLSVVQGSLIYGTGVDTVTVLAKNTSSTRYLSNTGASNNPAWAQIDLTNGVTGTLPVGSGGTGAGAFTAGSVIYAGAAGVYSQNNATFFWDNTNTILYLGGNSGAFTDTRIHAIGTSTGSLQVNTRNLSNGTSASSDLVATADTGTNTTNYINVGINSSTYNDAAYTIAGALAGYVYTNGGDLALGTQTANSLLFHTGGTLVANNRLSISSTGVATFTGTTTASFVVNSVFTQTLTSQFIGNFTGTITGAASGFLFNAYKFTPAATLAAVGSQSWVGVTITPAFDATALSNTNKNTTNLISARFSGNNGTVDIHTNGIVTVSSSVATNYPTNHHSLDIIGTMNASTIGGVFKTSLNVQAAANSDILYGFNVAPTFTIGANTGVVVTGYDYNPTISGSPTSHFAALYRSGSVGIGLAAPTAKLQIQGLSTTTGELFKLQDSTPTVRLVILESGAATVTGGWTWSSGNVIVSTGSMIVGGGGTAVTVAAGSVLFANVSASNSIGFTRAITTDVLYTGSVPTIRMGNIQIATTTTDTDTSGFTIGGNGGAITLTGRLPSSGTMITHQVGGGAVSFTSNSNWYVINGTLGNTLTGTGTTYSGMLFQPTLNHTAVTPGTGAVVGWSYSPIITALVGINQTAFGANGGINSASGNHFINGFTASPTMNTSGTYVGINRGYHFNPTNTATIGVTQYGAHIQGGVTAASGTSNYTGVFIAPVYAATVSHTGGLAVGIDYNPTLTGVVGLTHYAMRLNSGSVLIGTAIGTLSTALNIKQAGQAATSGIRMEDSATSNGFSMYYTSGTSFIMAPDGTTDLLVGHVASTTGNTTIRAGRGITISSFNNSSFAAVLVTTASDYSSTASSNFFRLTPGYNVASGTGTHTIFPVNPTYNFTGTYVGTVIGIDYSPTNTALTGVTHYAMLIRSGSVIIGASSGTAKFQVKGVGNTTGELFRLDDSTPTNRLLILENGTTTLTAAGTSSLTTSTGTFTIGAGTSNTVYGSPATGNVTHNHVGTSLSNANTITYAVTASKNGAANYVRSFSIETAFTSGAAITSANEGYTGFSSWIAMSAGSLPNTYFQHAVDAGDSTTSWRHSLLLKTTLAATGIFWRVSSFIASTTAAQVLSLYSPGIVNSASNAGTFTLVQYGPSITRTVSSTGDYVGIDYNPTVSILGIHYAMLIKSGLVGIGTATPTGLLHIVQPAIATLGQPAFRVDGGAHTTLTASTEFFDNYFNGARTVQWATGTLATQRFTYFNGATVAFVAASILTDAYGVFIEKPIAGANATITNNWALGLGGNLQVDGDIKLKTAGQGIYIKEGSNATMGVATLVAGVATINTTKVTANSRINISIQSLGTVASPKAIAVTGRVNGTSFTITSADLTDTSIIMWVILEPN